MEDAIDQLRQEVEVLRQSLEELTVVFEHAVNNGRIVIEVTQGPIDSQQAASSRGNRKQNPNHPHEAIDPVSSEANQYPEPTPGKLF